VLPILGTSTRTYYGTSPVPVRYPVQYPAQYPVQVRPRPVPVPVPQPMPQPVPPPAPGPTAGASGAQYNLARVNAYRTQAGLPALTIDPALSAFAEAGSQQLSMDHQPHGHFREQGQGDPNGVYQLDPDPTKNLQKQIDQMLQLMIGEGPGGGHYDNIMNPAFRRIGIGLLSQNGQLYMTNDFST
jgi:uncharacterized protein YkwD